MFTESIIVSFKSHGAADKNHSITKILKSFKFELCDSYVLESSLMAATFLKCINHLKNITCVQLECIKSTFKKLYPAFHRPAEKEL